MKLLQRLFSAAPDPREALRPLWNAVVGVAREPRWYRDGSVLDSVEGRFDMVTLVLSLVLLRLDREGAVKAGARLTELFIDDMDAQLRQSGIGDLVVGKLVGKLMAALGGRMGALRGALPAGSAAVAAAVERNVSLREGASPDPLAQALIALDEAIAAAPLERLLAGELPR
jgi:cytochrome b pre-mRNA-processing protein 3